MNYYYITSVLDNGSEIKLSIKHLKNILYSAVSFAEFKANHRSNNWLLVDDLTQKYA